MPLFVATGSPSGPRQAVGTECTEIALACGNAVRLTAAEHNYGVAQLQNVGQSVVHVEVQCDYEGGPYELYALVEPQEIIPVGANTRFYVAGEQATTMQYLVFAAGDSLPSLAPATAAQPVSGPPASQPGSSREAAAGTRKRARPNSPVSTRSEAGPSHSGHQAAAAPAAGDAAAAGVAVSLDSVPDSPMHLMRVRYGIPSWANEGFLGVTLRDVVRGDIRWALVSNYKLDLRWLLSACPDLTRAQQLVLVHGERNEHLAHAILATLQTEGLQERTTVHMPKVHDFGTHHSKAFLLGYERGLRVVIFTANAIYPDCNNKSEGLFWQDFPRKDAQSPDSTSFHEDLVAYLHKLNLPRPLADHWTALLARHDFSAARAHLVASVPGKHRGADMKRWGHLRLRALLSSEPPFPSVFKGAPLVAQFSSLGRLDEKWLYKEFRASLAAGRCGTNGSEQLGLPAPRAQGLQLVWPAVQEVQNSLEGWKAGGSIPGHPDNVNKPFLEPHFRRWGGEVCGRQRAMPHMKTYLRYAPGTRQLAWLYVGSHNLSKAAWGALQHEGSQLFVRSFELGVLLLPSTEAAYRASRWRGFSCTSSKPWRPQPPPQQQAAPGVQAAAGAGPPSVRFVQWQRSSSQEARAAGLELEVPLPVPYALPPQPYMRGEGPWTTKGTWPGYDSLGRTITHPHGADYGYLDDDDYFAGCCSSDLDQ